MTDILDKEKILKIREVNRSFIDERTGEPRQILKDINLSVFEGEFISILGASGCGKTTLLRLIAGLDPVQEGKIILDGEPVHGPDSKRGYVFQQGCLFPWLTVEDNIAMGLKIRGVYKQNKDKVHEFIEKIGLGGFEKNFPHQISGGMAQRVAIARALINEPEILLLDEPMGALDSFTRADIQNLLLELRKERNTTMILVTHDIDEALYLSDRIVIMTPRPGRISEVLEIRDSFPRERGSAQFLEKRRNLYKKSGIKISHTIICAVFLDKGYCKMQ